MYPAIKMNMGKWEYYVIRMTMKEVADNIKYAHEVHENPTLATWIQRAINTSRVKKQIVKYLANSEHRFFSSLVVAGFEGNPDYYYIDVKDQPEFTMIQERLKDTFCVISWDTTISTYALDGQHRLSAIKELVNSEQQDYQTPTNFEEETISVLYLRIQEGQTEEEFIKDFRRIFANLNRHAKPVDKNVIVIMDEDDRYAIATRNLITNHEFFNINITEESEGKTSTVCDFESKTESLSRRSDSLITIVGLYKMVIHLLWTPENSDNISTYPSGVDFTNHTQESPSDEESDRLERGLMNIWDGILETFPALSEQKPSEQRSLQEQDKGNNKNLLYFRPIGQTEILAPLIRRVLDRNDISLPDTSAEVVKVLKPLTLIPWDLFHDIWRDFLIISEGEPGYKMRNEERTKVLKIASNIIDWVSCLEPLTDDGINLLRARWSAYLIPAGNNKREKETFDKLLEIREKISGMVNY